MSGEEDENEYISDGIESDTPIEKPINKSSIIERDIKSAVVI
jgi:hypothetical protein